VVRLKPDDIVSREGFFMVLRNCPKTAVILM
jgi:hypothetical protein